MQRAHYRSRTAPKNQSRARVWHRKPASPPKGKPAGRLSNFVNISTEHKHGRGPRK